MAQSIIRMDRIRAFFRRLILINDTPHKIAGGAALGIFLGIMPGEGVLATLVMASLLRLNLLAATTGVLATNMWTTVAVLPVAAAVGGFAFHVQVSTLVDDFHRNYHMGLKQFLSEAVLLDVALPLMVGFVIVAGVLAVLAYAGLSCLLHHHSMKPADR